VALSVRLNCFLNVPLLYPDDRSARYTSLDRDGCLIVHGRLLLSGCVGRFGPQPIRRKLRGNFAALFKVGVGLAPASRTSPARSIPTQSIRHATLSQANSREAGMVRQPDPKHASSTFTSAARQGGGLHANSFWSIAPQPFPVHANAVFGSLTRQACPEHASSFFTSASAASCRRARHPSLLVWARQLDEEHASSVFTPVVLPANAQAATASPSGSFEGYPDPCEPHRLRLLRLPPRHLRPRTHLPHRQLMIVPPRAPSRGRKAAPDQEAWGSELDPQVFVGRKEFGSRAVRGSRSCSPRSTPPRCMKKRSARKHRLTDSGRCRKPPRLPRAPDIVSGRQSWPARV